MRKRLSWCKSRCRRCLLRSRRSCACRADDESCVAGALEPRGLVESAVQGREPPGFGVAAAIETFAAFPLGLAMDEDCRTLGEAVLGRASGAVVGLGSASLPAGASDFADCDDDRKSRRSKLAFSWSILLKRR